MRKKTKAIVCGAALFGVVSLAVANNTRSTEAVEGETEELAVSAAEESASAEAAVKGNALASLFKRELAFFVIEEFNRVFKDFYQVGHKIYDF